MKKDELYDQINKNAKNTFKVGHNKYSDKTDEEMLEMLITLPLSLPK